MQDYEFRFLTPVQDVPGVFFFALSAPVHVTMATHAQVEQGVHCAMAKQMHKWFELDAAFETTHDVAARFASDLQTILQRTLAAARIEPWAPAGPDRRIPFGGVRANIPFEAPDQGYPHRWRLHGLEFREATGRLSFRIEPWPMRKLKLLTMCGIAKKKLKVEPQNEN
jgi:hypothetical protein